MRFKKKNKSIVVMSSHYHYNINRFIYLVLLFVISITFLIIRPNIIIILLGWDGLSLVSYCSVIYYQNVKRKNIWTSSFYTEYTMFETTDINFVF